MNNLPSLFKSDFFRNDFFRDNSWMNDFWAGMPSMLSTNLPRSWPANLPNMELLPSCEVSETEKAYEIRAEMPGMTRENIKIDLEGSRLTIRGERKEEHKEDRAKRHVSEVRYGSYYRSFELPSAIDAERTTAEYRDGVLKISAPKNSSQNPSRQISIKG